MADNVQISDNPIIAADVIGGVTHQRVKAQWGVDGVAVDTSATNPLPVYDSSASAYLYTLTTSGTPIQLTDGVNNLDLLDLTNAVAIPSALVDTSGNQLSFSTPITVQATPSITATTYTTLYNLDGAIISFANAAAFSGGGGYIDHIQVIDKSGSGGGGKNLNIVFLRSDPAGLPDGENAAFSFTDAELEEVSTIVSTSDADWYDLGDGHVAEVDVSPPRPFEITSGTTLYCVVQVVGSWTFASTSDIILRPHFVRN